MIFCWDAPLPADEPGEQPPAALSPLLLQEGMLGLAVDGSPIMIGNNLDWYEWLRSRVCCLPVSLKALSSLAVRCAGEDLWLPRSYSRLALSLREPPVVRLHRFQGICGVQAREDARVHKRIQYPQCSVAFYTVLFGHHAQVTVTGYQYGLRIPCQDECRKVPVGESPVLPVEFVDLRNLPGFEVNDLHAAEE